MSPFDEQAVADYSKGNRPSRGPEDRFAEPISRGVGGAGGGGPRARIGAVAAVAQTARLLLLGAGFVGAVALIAADLSNLYEIRVGSVVMVRVSGHHQHDFALLLLGLAALPMLFGALRGARPAMLAIAVIGLAALFAGPIADRNDVGSTGDIGDLYTGASAHTDAGYRLEIVGSVLVLLSGGGLVLLEARDAGLRVRLRRPRRGGAGGDGEGEEDAPAPALSVNPYAEDESG